MSGCLGTKQVVKQFQTGHTFQTDKIIPISWGKKPQIISLIKITSFLLLIKRIMHLTYLKTTNSAK